MPDFIFRNDLTKSIVEKAINSMSLGNPKYAEHFLLYPTDFSLIGVAMALDIPKMRSSTSTRWSSSTQALLS
jgi:hypothetical protein